MTLPLTRVPLLLGVLALLVSGSGAASASPAPDRLGPTTAPATPARMALPAVGHVFVINIENEGAGSTYGPHSAAPYLAKTLRSKGVFVKNYYGTAHPSLPNYLAQISGQAPNAATHGNCQTFTEFTQTDTVAPDQAVGSGCVFPAGVPSLPIQLTDAGLSWKGYLDDMVTNCQHPDLGAADTTQHATPRHNYAVRHNPFMYFHAIIDDPAYCGRHVQKLTRLPKDLGSVASTPKLSYITPDLCHDGHDTPCADGSPGGLKSVNAWLKKWVSQILQSPAYKRDGMIVITADEAERRDSSACCGEVPGPNSPLPGIDGPGGGRVGAVVLSRFVEPGTMTRKGYHHYSLLATLEDLFGLARIGYATGARAFGPDVFKRPTG